MGWRRESGSVELAQAPDVVFCRLPFGCNSDWFANMKVKLVQNYFR